tara:strand:- start:983 stop:1549 length:567 start_codon:yes stop_codon:yes gene_type:complete
MSSVNQGFWTENKADPKRNYRFQVKLTSGAAEGTAMDTGVIWFAKTVDKPEITVQTAEANYMAHKFYYPGSVEWNEVTLVLVDPVSPDAAEATLQMLKNMGYLGPEGSRNNPITPTKTASFEVVITQIDNEGAALETWTLKRAFITTLGFGQLDYSNEDLSEISMKVRYDWATCTVRGQEVPFFGNQG